MSYRRLRKLTPASQGSTDSYARKHARALEVGFTERQAPFIAMAASSRPGWSVARLRRHVMATMPWLFEDPAQGKLFDDEVAS